jgi:hypothetical protein
MAQAASSVGQLTRRAGADEGNNPQTSSALVCHPHPVRAAGTPGNDRTGPRNGTPPRHRENRTRTSEFNTISRNFFQSDP